MIHFTKRKDYLYLCCLFVELSFSITGKSQTITAYVGQTIKLQVPAPQYPYIYYEYAGWDNTQAPSLSYVRGDEYDAEFKVISSFAGTQVITCSYMWSKLPYKYYSRLSPMMNKTYYIKCSESGNNSGGSNSGSTTPDFELPESITLGVGQELDIAPYVNALFVTEWEYDSSIAFVSSTVSTQAVVQTVNGNAKLNAVGDGTFTLKAKDIFDGRKTSCTVNVPVPNIYLVLGLRDGSLNYFSFKDKPEVTFNGNSINIQTTVASITYLLSEIERFSFVDESIDQIPSGIEHVSNDMPIMSFKDNILEFKSCTPSSKIVISNINGLIEHEYKSTIDGSLSIDMNQYQQGIYIVKAGSFTYKVIKK
ncbi:MAG: T9SS type A sorting domain-containing protein [Prevotella sp.]|nr:T9SS type A sorting domain-containing protein [Prevotella sp.]